jgi:hypothetical protein
MISDHAVLYITRPIVVATVDATGFPQSLFATLRGCSCSSTSDCGSIYLWHIGYLVVHAAQRSKAGEQIVYTRASLDACTCELWFGLQILEQGDCPGCGEAVA